LTLGGLRALRVVGVAVEPDNVAFPLAGRPRVYVSLDEARDLAFEFDGTRRVSAAYVDVADPARLPETLVQARATSYGVTGLTFTTRTGVRALVDQAGGLVVALLSAFATITLAVAGAMLAATGHARVSRDLTTIGALRALGFTPRDLAWSYAAEAMLVAVPATALGIVLGSVLVAGPTEQLLLALNELPPPRLLGLPQLVALLLATAVAGVAAGRPAWAAGRRPIVETLDGAVVVRPRRTGTTGGPLMLGVRLAVARPGRLAVTVVALAASVATVFLLLAVGRFLLAAERDPSTIGERYSLVVPGQDGVLERVRATPGTAAAAERFEARGVDVFDLREPLTLVAFGAGASDVFAGRRAARRTARGGRRRGRGGARDRPEPRARGRRHAPRAAGGRWRDAPAGRRGGAGARRRRPRGLRPARGPRGRRARPAARRGGPTGRRHVVGRPGAAPPRTRSGGVRDRRAGASWDAVPRHRGGGAAGRGRGGRARLRRDRAPGARRLGA
jgi:hypothetical protein